MVDPVSGYRFYQPSQVTRARLVVHLRRVGLALDDIRTVLGDSAHAASILATRLRRLEAGLVDARREISIVHQLLENTEITMTRCTLPAAELNRALRKVRYAISSDPNQPTLNGVFLDSEPGRLRVVATDRYRLATTTVPTMQPCELRCLLPAAAVDELLAADQTGSLDVVVADGTITLSGGSGTVRAQVPDADFPPYRNLLDLGRREVPVDAAVLRGALDTDTTESLTRDDDGAAYQSVGSASPHAEYRSARPTIPMHW
jgi:DNA polymerase III subunit beta